MRGVTPYKKVISADLAFLLTRLMRGVTCVVRMRSEAEGFLLTRLMRGVTAQKFEPFCKAQISTHTPHARRDHDSLSDIVNSKISTHTPHARRDLSAGRSTGGKPFLLTRLMRGVTGGQPKCLSAGRFLLTRLMRGVTLPS